MENLYTMVGATIVLVALALNERHAYYRGNR